MKPRHIKFAEGQERNEEWRSMTPLEQLKDLDNRLGKGLGATRQRAKLGKAILKVAK